MSKAAAPPAKASKREPAASFDIPEGLLDSELGLAENRTCNAWAMDRVLGHLGVYSVEITDSIATSPDGKYAELVREGNKLLIFDKL
jgi:hypothetical protein